MTKKVLNNKKSTKKVEKKIEDIKTENISVESNVKVDSNTHKEEKIEKKRKKNDNFFSKAMNFLKF